MKQAQKREKMRYAPVNVNCFYTDVQ